MLIRPATSDDLGRMLELNNAAVPAVNELTLDEMAWFFAVARCCLVAEVHAVKDADAHDRSLRVTRPGGRERQLVGAEGRVHSWSVRASWRAPGWPCSG